ncbi:MAG: S9 family peptidase [Hyphomicrobiales bacterium]|nr:S9 family peptidase [Hyphomicrobiales bacterium]
MSEVSLKSEAPMIPAAERRPVSDTRHGITRTDDYAWLRADNWQEVMRDPSTLAPDIRAYLEAENDYTAAFLSDTETLQEALFQEMKGRIKEDDSTVPAPDGPHAYAMRYEIGDQHPRLVRTPRPGGAETMLLDANAHAEGKGYFQLAGASHSPDHRCLAWASDDKGSEYYTMRIRDLETGEDLEDTIPDTAGGGVWSTDSRYLFYSRLDDNHRPRAVYRHEIGTPVESDTLVYEEADPGFFTGPDKTQSGRFIIIDTHDHQTSETYLIDAEDPLRTPRLVAPREVEVEYDVEHHGDRLIIKTNADGAKDFKIAETPLDKPGRENWRDIVPHREGRLILSHVAYANHHVRLEREDGLPRIIIRRFSDGDEHAIAFDEEAYSLGLLGGYEFDTTVIRFSYSSMTTPSQIFDYDMETRERVLRKTQEVPSGHEPSDYVARRIMARAADGETVPVSILHHKDTPLDGSAPCLLYGYGSYGMTIPSGFGTKRFSLVDRGWIYAIAHVRGGKDKGFRWYSEGRQMMKRNTFSDFIAATECLILERFTSKGRIVAEGGSAGGMLMGVIANERPDLFGGILAHVPFVDVLTTMLDDTLPLTPPEWPEWGNPISDNEAYDYIASYSPYDNVSAQDYPPLLAVAGLTDPRVTYWEPAKWVAKLRLLKTNGNPVLLKTHMEAGHGGASGRFDSLKDDALAMAFALKMMNGGTSPN